MTLWGGHLLHNRADVVDAASQQQGSQIHSHRGPKFIN